MSFGFLQDEAGNWSSKRLIAVVSGIAIGVGAAAIEFAKAWTIYQRGGDGTGEIMAGAGAVCAMVGAQYVASTWAGTKKAAKAEEGEQS